MKSKIFKALGGILLFAAVFSAGEWALRLKNGPLSPEDLPDNFKYFHEDIYKDMFRKEQVNGWPVYRTARERAPLQEFPVKKNGDVFRIFVVGGSVAIPFVWGGQSRLIDFLKQAVPGRKFEIVGCGMGGYDSYRETLVQKKILEYEPDMIILLSGNNENITPMKLNPSVYKANFVMRKSRIFRGLQNTFFSKTVVLPPIRERLSSFEGNLKVMIRRAQKRGVPMVLCTLPVNIRDVPPAEAGLSATDPHYAEGWSALDRRLYLRALEQFKLYAMAHPQDPNGYYMMARCQDGLGRLADACSGYLQAVELDNPGGRCSPSRNDILRRLAGKDNVILADVEKSFLAAADPGLLDSRFFADNVHPFHEYYPLMSWVILKSIHDYNAARHAEVIAPTGKWDWSALADMRERLSHPRISSRTYEKNTAWIINNAISFSLKRSPDMMENAVIYFEIAAKREPGKVTAILGSLDKIEADFKANPWMEWHMVRLRKNWPLVLLHAGEALRRSGRYEDAFRFASEAIRLDPINKKAYMLRALIASRIGDKKRSESDRDRILMLDNDPYIKFWTSSLNRE